jgi:hypothetical protein
MRSGCLAVMIFLASTPAFAQVMTLPPAAPRAVNLSDRLQHAAAAVSYGVSVSVWRGGPGRKEVASPLTHAPCELA